MDAWRKIDEEKANRHYGREGNEDRDYRGYYGDANAQESLYPNRFGSERPSEKPESFNATETHTVNYGLNTESGFNRRLNLKRSEAKSFAGKGPRDWKRSDETIKEEACEALTQDRDIDASEIEVEVKNGIIYLSGTVDNRYAKRLAEECVENIFGVQDVQNQLKAGHL